MAGGRGGYRPPTNPAPVSGPGALSQRTDGGPGQPIRELPNAKYGEQAAFREAQQGAPMAQAPSPSQASPSLPSQVNDIIPLGSATQRPDEAVTAGVDVGDGVGSAALGLDDEDADPGVQNLRAILPSLELMANMPTAGSEFRQFVRRVRAEL